MHDLPQILIWHQKIFSQLYAAYLNKRFAHALLFVGAKGIGKTTFATQFANLIFCNYAVGPTDKQSKIYCGTCKNCHLLKANTHPDLLYITAKNNTISIDNIRELTNEFVTTPQIANYKIAIINNAEYLNVNAANALLKTLEEPLGNKIIILISENKNLLPQTVISRCKTINFSTPNIELAKSFLLENGIANEKINLLLMLANGAPLQALNLHKSDFLLLHLNIVNQLCDFAVTKKNIISLAAEYNKLDIELLFTSLLNILQDLIYLKVSAEQTRIINSDNMAQFQKIVSKCNTQDLFLLYDFLLQNRLQIKMYNLNKQLVIENFLAQWMQKIC